MTTITFPPLPFPPNLYFEANVFQWPSCSRTHPLELFPCFQGDVDGRYDRQPYRKQRGPNDLEVPNLASSNRMKTAQVKVKRCDPTAFDLSILRYSRMNFCRVLLYNYAVLLSSPTNCAYTNHVVYNYCNGTNRYQPKTRRVSAI